MFLEVVVPRGITAGRGAQSGSVYTQCGPPPPLQGRSAAGASI